MALLTWEGYSSLYDAIKDEETFNKAEVKAELEVARVIGLIRWAKISEGISGEFYAPQLHDCLCRVIDYQATTERKIGRGVSAVSNDGYSESYVLATQSAATEELDRNIRAWLSGTGLVRAY